MATIPKKGPLVTGGSKAKAFLQNAGTGGVKDVKVGFFSSARYPDGRPVAQVALSHEFGVRDQDGRISTPERPFFRLALREAEEPLTAYLKKAIGADLVLTKPVASGAGAMLKGAIQQSIVKLRDPPNTPATIKRKGSSNPLIDTGTMRLAVSWEVEE